MTFSEDVYNQSVKSIAIVYIDDVKSEYGSIFEFLKNIKQLAPFKSEVLYPGEEPTSEYSLIVPVSPSKISATATTDNRVYVLEETANIMDYLKNFVVRP